MKDICFTDYFLRTFHPMNPKYTKEELVSAYDDFYQNSVISKSYPYPFLNITLLITGMCHKSFYNESGKMIANYERLEFLGDAVLELVVTKILLEKYPEVDEGKLSKLRSSIVNEEALSKLALFCQLDKGILLGKGEFNNHQGTNKSILSDVFESLLGIVESEMGLGKAKEVFLSIVEEYNNKYQCNLFDINNLESFDAKSKLQELLMAEYRVTPEYKTEEIKVNKKTLFEVKLIINKTNLGELTHISKKKGMQELAQSILDKQTYKKLDNPGERNVT